MIKLMNGFVHINNKVEKFNFHYEIKSPSEITNGNWACKVAFFSNKKLLYYDSKYYAHQINNVDEFQICQFSLDKKLLYFYEFRPFDRAAIIVLSTTDSTCLEYIININNNLLSWVDNIFCTLPNSENIVEMLIDRGFLTKKRTKDSVFHLPLLNCWHGK